MLTHLTARGHASATAIVPLTEATLEAWLKSQPKERVDWVRSLSFTAKAGTHCLLPDGKGQLAAVLAGLDETKGPWSFAWLATDLPAGTYRFDPELGREQANHAALGWALAAYRFERYRKSGASFAKLAWPRAADRKTVTATVEAIGLTRDLINTPAGDLGPAELASAARSLARRHKAKLSVIAGDALLPKSYPAIHAVGRASSQAPRLIDLRWSGPGKSLGKGPGKDRGKRGVRKITLVGKGVCFDSGGLDLKPAAGMRLMKKDMGGAAHVLGLAHMIMALGLPVALRVLVPAVENAVSSNAFRPGDVLQTRKGLTVEIGNTDAEGRLVLCDALAEADRDKPDLIVDFATLTGAARVALGTDLPALFSNHDELSETLLAQGLARHDPLWRLPLHKPYRGLLDSKLADLNNVSEGGFGGAITAALFLEAFVSAQTPWIHIDLMAWNLKDRPGRPAGGEAMGLRAVYGLIEAMARGG